MRAPSVSSTSCMIVPISYFFVWYQTVGKQFHETISFSSKGHWLAKQSSKNSIFIDFVFYYINPLETKCVIAHFSYYSEMRLSTVRWRCNTTHTWLAQSWNGKSRLAESTLCLQNFTCPSPWGFLPLSKIKNSKNEEGVIWKKTSYLLCSQLARKSWKSQLLGRTYPAVASANTGKFSLVFRVHSVFTSYKLSIYFSLTRLGVDFLWWPWFVESLYSN